MAVQSSSSYSSFTHAFTYDVFLNFRGIDTRFGFAGNLYKALTVSGICTFIDDGELNRGDEITPTLTKAIQESRIAIPIFSVNYASSSFCLDELVTIIDCVKAKGRLVLPVFYDVDPSLVRHQKETYCEALAKYQEKFKENREKFKDNMERLQNWKIALHQAANLSGMHFKSGKQYEYEFIEKIVQEVSDRISRVPLHVADYPVGLESRVLNVLSLLDVGSGNGVHMVGIYGTGGMGKTTLARAVYNFIADQFESLCFLPNVRENSAMHGLEHIQEDLLSQVVGLNIKVGDISKGISVIKRRLCQKKVLLILDDVDKLEQLRSIVGGRNWFGSGSRVIITTRDKQLLVSHGVERKYEVYRLNEKEALELLSWNAFKNDKVDPCYKNVLHQAIAYTSGLPLALEVIGSNLCGKSIRKWQSALKQYERIPNKKIQIILEVSFDALEEQEQSVFLDVACCLKGYRLAEVQNILQAHYGACVEHHIGVLVEKSLIKITLGILRLHDLIEDMGKEIVRRESPKEPGKRSRLWFHEDIFEVLEENTGTSKIEMTFMDFTLFKEVKWDGEAFKEMKNLKTLVIKSGRFSKGPSHLPDSLRVLEWCNYPSQHLPYDFNPKKLSIFKLPNSSITSLELQSLSKGQFGNMKVLNFDYCRYLTNILDVSNLPNLEELSFKYCKNLVTIHNSVGLLHKLKILDAMDCNKLRNFPPLKLPSLKKLDLFGCSSLRCFPEILEKMKHVTSLDLDSRYITEFPPSFRNLTRLRRLRVSRWLPKESLDMMPQLAELTVFELIDLQDESEEKVSSMLLSSNVEFLSLAHCLLSNTFLGFVLPFFAKLKELDLSWCKLTIVPKCIKECRFLSKLKLDGCDILRDIEGIPPSLKYFTAYRCKSLSYSCRSMLLMQELHEAGNTDFLCPSPETGRIPEWFEHQSRGLFPSISFWFRNNFPNNMLLCVVSPLWAERDHKVDLIVNDKIFFYEDSSYVMPVRHGHTLVHMLSEKFTGNVEKALVENGWNHAVFMIKERSVSSGQISIDIGIHVLNEKSSMEDIQFTDPLIYETPYGDFTSEWPRSSTDEKEGDESSNYETPPEDDFNSESSLSSTGSDGEEGYECSNLESSP